MIKRPLLFAAVLAVLAAAVLYRIDPGIFVPDISFSDKEKIILTGTIYRLENKNDKINVYLKNAYARVTSDQEYSSVGRAVLIMSEDDFSLMDLKVGNSVSSDAVFRSFGTARNYGNYDEGLYYHSMGVFLKAQAEEVFVTDGRTDAAGQFLYELQRDMIRSIKNSVSDPETAGILISVCTGDRTWLSTDTKEMYRRSGEYTFTVLPGSRQYDERSRKLQLKMGSGQKKTGSTRVE